MYNQARDLRDYASRIEISLRNTYGYHRMDGEAKGTLVRAADEYGRRLDGRKEFSRMSDVTGFSPETMEDAARRAKAAGITEKDWSGPGLFSGSRLAALMEEMTEMPETRLAGAVASKTFDRGALGEIVSDRISGKPIPEISMEHFGGAGADTGVRPGHIRKDIPVRAGPVCHAPDLQRRGGRQPAGHGVLRRGHRRGSADADELGAAGRGRRHGHGVRGEARRARLQALRGEGVARRPGRPRVGRGGAGMSGVEYERVWRRLAGLD